MTDRLPVVRKGKEAQGKKELIKHLNGERLTMKQAIKARYYDCCGYYADGKVDCKVPNCALYPYMPFSIRFKQDRADRKQANLASGIRRKPPFQRKNKANPTSDMSQDTSCQK